VKLLLFSIFAAMLVSPAWGQVVNPYRCEGTPQEAGRILSLKKIRAKAEEFAKRKDAVSLCTAAELYKRLGDSKAFGFYEKAIEASPDEPAFELFYADYLRLYRGAGQRPMFPQAEQHLLRATDKLKLLGSDGTSLPECSDVAWHKCTQDRVQRSLTTLYERDGIHLANRGPGTQRPWLFLSPGIRLARSTDDFDQPSDVRDLTSAALFSQNCLPLNDRARRLCTALSGSELAGMVRSVTPMEANSTLRIRYNSAPVLDVLASARRTEKGAINSIGGFFIPDAFSDLKLINFGFRIEKPFVITGATDVDLQFAYDHINREGLIEFFPTARERIGQYQAYAAISHYMGPDRVNLSYTYVRQNIDPTPHLTQRDRELMGGTIDYQLFRPLALYGRDANTGLGRHFETRGIDLIGGFLNDRDHFTGPNPNVITRHDYFVGAAVRGLDRFDATIQPTWYSSRVSIDSTENNSQLRITGNLLTRILDEERTPGIPSERLFGMPVAFVEVVIPFHWDIPQSNFKAFQSRSVGGELSSKFFTNSQAGVTVLAVAGYSRDWFPILNKAVNLARLGVSIGF
jgi:hypothetical protein